MGFGVPYGATNGIWGSLWGNQWDLGFSMGQPMGFGVLYGATNRILCSLWGNQWASAFPPRPLTGALSVLQAGWWRCGRADKRPVRRQVPPQPAGVFRQRCGQHGAAGPAAANGEAQNPGLHPAASRQARQGAARVRLGGAKRGDR